MFDENFGREKILASFNEHPLILALRSFLTILFGALIIFPSFFVRDFLPPQVFIWGTVVFALVLVSTLIRFYVFWEIGGDFITEHEIVRVEPQGIFRHNVERFLLDEVKVFDIEQTGFWQSILDCGDIHITSEMGPRRDIILTNVWPAQKTFAVLEKAISRFSFPPSYRFSKS